MKIHWAIFNKTGTTFMLYRKPANHSKGYRKFPKYSDTQKICCNHLQSWTRWCFLRVMHPKDAEGIANSVDPDQTAPSLIWVCTVCPDLSVRKLRKIMVFLLYQPMTICIQFQILAHYLPLITVTFSYQTFAILWTIWSIITITYIFSDQM